MAVNKNLSALELLHDHVTSKRTRNSPIASLEPVMILFVELCVSLRKGKTAKDGLYQYKNIAQNTSVQTIEVCLFSFYAFRPFFSFSVIPPSLFLSLFLLFLSFFCFHFHFHHFSIVSTPPSTTPRFRFCFRYQFSLSILHSHPFFE